MTTTVKFAEIAALAGEPSRAVILHALLEGRALTATELAHVAGVTPQTASGHLARMIDAGLLSVTQQGRHRYHRLASPAVAHMMESIMIVASAPTSNVCQVPSPMTGRRSPLEGMGRVVIEEIEASLAGCA